MMSDDFSKYEAMRDRGASPEEVFREAKRDGLDPITRIRLIRVIHSLSLSEAKEVMLRAEGIASSRDEFQGRILEKLKEEIADAKDELK